jgi:hypothetical protein
MKKIFVNLRDSFVDLCVIIKKGCYTKIRKEDTKDHRVGSQQSAVRITIEHWNTGTLEQWNNR